MSDESSFSDDGIIGWIQWFCSLEDHQFFCEVSEDFIRQPFNLHGLKNKVKNYSNRAPSEEETEDAKFLELYQEAIELYGLIHSRYICSPEGLAIMREKYQCGKFGTCPRVLCEKQNVIPIGISEDCKVGRVKIYCPRCKDIYSPKKKAADVDGAYFGTSFPHLLLMTYPDIHSIFPKTEYIPSIFGFKIESIPEQESNKTNENINHANELDKELGSTEVEPIKSTKKNKKKNK